MRSCIVKRLCTPGLAHSHILAGSNRTQDKFLKIIPVAGSNRTQDEFLNIIPAIKIKEQEAQKEGKPIYVKAGVGNPFTLRWQC